MRTQSRFGDWIRMLIRCCNWLLTVEVNVNDRAIPRREVVIGTDKNSNVLFDTGHSNDRVCFLILEKVVVKRHFSSGHVMVRGFRWGSCLVQDLDINEVHWRSTDECRWRVWTWLGGTGCQRAVFMRDESGSFGHRPENYGSKTVEHTTTIWHHFLENTFWHGDLSWTCCIFLRHPSQALTCASDRQKRSFLIKQRETLKKPFECLAATHCTN